MAISIPVSVFIFTVFTVCPLPMGMLVIGLRVQMVHGDLFLNIHILEDEALGYRHAFYELYEI